MLAVKSPCYLYFPTNSSKKLLEFSSETKIPQGNQIAHYISKQMARFKIQRNFTQTDSVST